MPLYIICYRKLNKMPDSDIVKQFIVKRKYYFLINPFNSFLSMENSCNFGYILKIDIEKINLAKQSNLYINVMLI